ncbi:MAG: hypothetical protein O7I93_17490 [Gemmatimonadetes bacterium]|nr:hypothetical protein [Gemmatimonadota bacterium]
MSIVRRIAVAILGIFMIAVTLLVAHSVFIYVECAVVAVGLTGIWLARRNKEGASANLLTGTAVIAGMLPALVVGISDSGVAMWDMLMAYALPGAFAGIFLGGGALLTIAGVMGPKAPALARG